MKMKTAQMLSMPPRVYGFLTLQHKHLPEMQAKLLQMQNPPIFTPVVADYYSGMC